MINQKKYTKPKFAIISFSDNLLDTGNAGINTGSNPDDLEDKELDVKIQSFRIFDDSFDDMSSAEESE